MARNLSNVLEDALRWRICRQGAFLAARAWRRRESEHGNIWTCVTTTRGGRQNEQQNGVGRQKKKSPRPKKAAPALATRDWPALANSLRTQTQNIRRAGGRDTARTEGQVLTCHSFHSTARKAAFSTSLAPRTYAGRDYTAPYGGQPGTGGDRACRHAPAAGAPHAFSSPPSRCAACATFPQRIRTTL